MYLKRFSNIFFLHRYITSKENPFWWRIFHHDITIMVAGAEASGSRLASALRSKQSLDAVSVSLTCVTSIFTKVKTTKQQKHFVELIGKYF